MRLNSSITLASSEDIWSTGWLSLKKEEKGSTTPTSGTMEGWQEDHYTPWRIGQSTGRYLISILMELVFGSCIIYYFQPMFKLSGIVTLLALLSNHPDSWNPIAKLIALCSSQRIKMIWASLIRVKNKYSVSTTKMDAHLEIYTHIRLKILFIIVVSGCIFRVIALLK